MTFPLPPNLRKDTPDTNRMVAMFTKDGVFRRDKVDQYGFMPCYGSAGSVVGWLEISEALALAAERRARHEGAR